MKNIGFEYYYLSGLPIDANKYGLGVIHQPTFRDFVLSNISFEEFIYPFCLNKGMVKGNSDELDRFIDSIDDLTFLFIFDMENKNSNIIDKFIECLKIIYKTNNVKADKKNAGFIVDDIKIDEKNFSIFIDLILEMLVVKKINKETVKDNELINEFERRRREYETKVREKNNKNNSLFLLDIVNIVIHSQDLISYNSVLDMTVYQIKNSFNVLTRRDSFNRDLMYKVSPKFDVKDEIKHWYEQSKVSKSNLD